MKRLQQVSNMPIYSLFSFSHFKLLHTGTFQIELLESFLNYLLQRHSKKENIMFFEVFLIISMIRKYNNYKPYYIYYDNNIFLYVI